MHTGDGALLLAHTGEIAIAAWTEANADHTRIINAAAAALEGEVSSGPGFGEPLPDGFILREGKGGADAVLSMLADAIEEGNFDEDDESIVNKFFEPLGDLDLALKN